MENIFTFNRKTRKVIIIMLICICISAVFTLQPVNAAEADSEFFMDSHMQQLYTSKDGLPATSTTAITQTDDGFIWLGGYGGLAKYDGREFRVIGAGKISNVKCLLSDKDGVLWIGSSDMGLAKYQKDRLSFVEYADKSDRCSVECIVKHSNGQIYFGTEKGLGVINKDNKVEILKVEQLYGQLISHIVCADKKLYCMTKDGQLYRYDGKNCEQIKLDIEGQIPRSISYDEKKGHFLIGTDGNRIADCSKNFSSIDIVTVDEAKCINDLMRTDAGNIWVCADNGVMLLGKDGEVRTQELIIKNSIDEMMIDMEGNMWFISSRQGVLKISNSMFMNISQSAKLGEIVANAVYCQNGRIYIGHDEGLSIVDEKTLTEIKDSSFDILESVRIRDIYKDSKGALWFATNERGLLCRSKSGEWKTYSQEEYPQIKSNNFRCAVQAKDGSIIAGSDSGAYVIKDDKVRNLIDNADEVTCRILCVEAVDDICYIGTDGYGIYAVKDGKIIEHYGTENGLTSNVIMKIRQGATQDILLLVTGNNITTLSRDGELKNIRKFPASNILDIVIQKGGIVWIPTGGGVYRITEKNLIKDVMKYDLLTRTDGMPFDCTANSKQCIVGSRMYLCGSEGVFSLDIDRFSTRNYKYPVTVDYVTADDKNLFVEGKREIKIDSDAERISMQVHVPTYVPENPVVFYYLQDVDRDKVFTRLRNLENITYTNIKGGEYSFYFGIIDDESGEILKQTKLVINKEKKFIETTFARVAIVLLTVLLFFVLLIAGVRYLNRKREAEIEEFYKNREREKLEQMAYWDYLTGLYNRNQINKWLEKDLTSEDYPISMIMADCNNLKVANDTYGHATGNKLIQETAKLLRNQFGMDDDRYTVIRVGGDEFAVVCCGVTEQECREKMEKVIKEAEGCMVKDIPVSFCYGIASMQEDEFDFDECLKLADFKLVEEKKKYHEMHDIRR